MRNPNAYPVPPGIVLINCKHCGAVPEIFAEKKWDYTTSNSFYVVCPSVKCTPFNCTPNVSTIAAACDIWNRAQRGEI